MKIRNLGFILGIGALAVWGASCGQPSIDCRATRGAFAAKYVHISGSGACADLKGDVVGLQSYYAPSADGKNVDVTKSSLALKAAELGRLAERYLACTACKNDDKCEAGESPICPDCVGTRQINSVGDFASVDPDAAATCSVARATTGEFTSAAIPPRASEDPEDPCKEELKEVSVKYEWSNVRVLVSPDAPGNRFDADLTYTENGCTAVYKVCGVWPVVSCEVVDAEGNPTGKTDETLCSQEVINQDFSPKCDPDIKLCVLPNCPL